MVPELRDDGKLYWMADSDSALTKVGPQTWFGKSQDTALCSNAEVLIDEFPSHSVYTCRTCLFAAQTF